MQAAAALSEPAVRLEIPVRSLLQQKPHAKSVWSIGPDETVYRAVELMAEKHVGCLVVLVAGQLTGIVTERDYARKVILKGRSSHETPVREIMSWPVLFVTPEQSVDHAMRLMTERRIRHLPVVKGDAVVGMISIGDLVNCVVSSQRQAIRHLEQYIYGDYPA